MKIIHLSVLDLGTSRIESPGTPTAGRGGLAPVENDSMELMVHLKMAPNFEFRRSRTWITIMASGVLDFGGVHPGIYEHFFNPKES